MLSRRPAVRSASEPIASSCVAGLGRERVELGPRARQRLEEMIGAFVAIRRELGEALVDQRETAVDLGDHALRCAFLLGDPARQGFERVCWRDRCWRASVSAALGAGLADAGGRLLDQGRDRGRLGVDAGANLLEGFGGSLEQCIERAGKARLSLVDRAGGSSAGDFDLGQPAARGVSLASPSSSSASRVSLGESADLAPEFGRLRSRIRCRPSEFARRATRAVFSARGRSSSSTAMSLRADSAARSSASPCRTSFSLLESNSRVMPPSLPVASSPSCIRCWEIIVSSVRLSLIRCERTSSSASSEWVSVRIATTERVNRSASLRRVRPNISQTRPSNASGPAASAIHCANAGEVSGCPPVRVRPTRRCRRATARRGASERCRVPGGRRLPRASCRCSGPLLLASNSARTPCRRWSIPAVAESPPAVTGEWRPGRAWGLGFMAMGSLPSLTASRKRLERIEARLREESGGMARGALIGAYQEDDFGGLRALASARRPDPASNIRCAAPPRRALRQSWSSSSACRRRFRMRSSGCGSTGSACSRSAMSMRRSADSRRDR